MSATSERGVPPTGAASSPFWADRVPPAPADPALHGEPLIDVESGPPPTPLAEDEATGDRRDPAGELDEEVASDSELSAELDGDATEDRDVDAEGDAEKDEAADGDENGGEDEDSDAETKAAEEAEAAERTRFAEMVEERLRRAHYAHHLTRTVFTPGEAEAAVLVERRAAIWVPTLTFVATLVSAAAAVVLATRLRGDPADPTGHQLLIVMITVCLLAAAFGILLRTEVHYERLRPRGRTVRHDVADAYEIVRDAPRRLVRIDAPLDVLRRVSELLPAAEQLVDALVEYTLKGGGRVREHPAYERILRMRAEVEVIEVILAEREEKALEQRLGRQPRASDVRTSHEGTPLPRPEQVANFNGLEDLAAKLDPDS